MIKDYITFAEMRSFVNDVVTLCVTDGKYQPYMRDFAYNYCILKYFTDYSVEDKDAEKLYSDFYQNNEVKQIIDMIKSNNSQLVEIDRCINDTFRTIIEREIRQSKLGKFIEELFDKLDNEETIDLLAEIIEKSGEIGGKKK